MGRTIVYNLKTKKTYVGDFDPTQTYEAHKRLCRAADIDAGECVGGSLKSLGHGDWEFKQGSSSLNDKFKSSYGGSDGHHNAHGNFFKKCIDDLQNGNYIAVSNAGSLNHGQQRFNITNHSTDDDGCVLM